MQEPRESRQQDAKEWIGSATLLLSSSLFNASCSQIDKPMMVFTRNAVSRDFNSGYTQIVKLLQNIYYTYFSAVELTIYELCSFSKSKQYRHSQDDFATCRNWRKESAERETANK